MWVEKFDKSAGDYVAMEAIKNYTRDEKKIVTNQNLQQLEPQFDPYKGTEICEKIPSKTYEIKDL